MTPRRALVIVAPLAIVLLAVVIAAVVRSDGDETSGDADGAASTARPTTTASHEQDVVAGMRFLPEDRSADGPLAPLTGLPVSDADLLDRPLLAVKVDDLDVPGETARPQSGLAAADVVVEEVVEGGITRFIVLLHSTDATEVGPVRSARTTDVHLLPAFGTALFAFSGGNPGVVSAVRSAPSLVDRGGEGPPAYHRDPRRRPPHDLFVRPAEIWSRPGGAPPRRLAAFLPVGGRSTAGQVVDGVAIEHAGSAATAIRWEWLPAAHRWVRHQGGTLHVDSSGFAVGPRNVIVLVADHVASPADARSPEAVTVGGGEAWSLIEGRVVVGRWLRPTEDDPISLVDGSGEPVTLTPGRTWIELVPPGRARLLPE